MITLHWSFLKFTHKEDQNSELLIVLAMAADDLVIIDKVPMASTAMVLILLFWNIPVAAPEGLMLSILTKHVCIRTCSALT